MEPRIHFITLATPDLGAARAFYRDGLGWEPLADVPGEIIFFQAAPGLVLGLFDAVKFREDVGGAVPDTSVTGVTLSHNVDSPEAVDTVVASAVRAGARLVKAPQRAGFGGYHGHFADPNGVLWEICHNPGWHVDGTGRVSLEPAG
ncbi:VOC family protein [Amycolatopsis sp. H20-H5]|uniref:VOC family protein n=1 Tax=Amycolatopsis sp. H20-H5 TaxID=3046309 RepID=UPI002DBFDDD6|nr:VOC family protein [Amycolatopsis sp. H20-H5]MEC3976055.1 VOC family protein [Amycolatopsis sp. H20-H5]